MSIKKAAVLGAGVMGAQIAGHLAGCGVGVLLLDLGVLALKGIEHLKKSKPPAMFDLDDLKLIRAGSFEDDLPKIADCDLVIEAVVEQLDIKQKLFSRIEPYLAPGAIVCSNTSGILARQLVEGRGEAFCQNFLITHFFNPVRYMKLVEIVAGPKTRPEAVSEISSFLSGTLGKGVVVAKDTPNFIANRIGMHSVWTAMCKVAAEKWPIEVVDQVMGAPTARPKSAIFRTADIVGIDTLAHVAKNSGLELPAFVQEMVKRGWVGDKAGQGFYKKVRSSKSEVRSSEYEILVLDPVKMEYRPQAKSKTPSLGLAKNIDDPAERLRTMVNADDEAGKIAKELVMSSVCYADQIWAEIADDPDEVDRAMRWGFNWELGPFEQKLALKKTGQQAGRKPARQMPAKIIESNAGADLTDLGDGVFGCEFHTKMNAIDGDVIAMIGKAVELAEKDGAGLVIGNGGANFSAGANLMLIFLAASNGQWGEIDKMIRAFQEATNKIRFCKKPVVCAPFGLTLGGGCEISIAAASNVAAAETYMGLVETGVGLIPAGGGCKNMVLKMEERNALRFNPKNKIWYSPEDGGPFPKARDAFQTIAFAKVSSSGKEAKKLGFLKNSDRIILVKENLISEAKKRILEISRKYVPPQMREDIILPGAGGKAAIVNGIRQAKIKGEISEHDAFIGEKLAHILTGGDTASTHKTTEQHLLELEREAFMSLCGMPKTLERIQHTLKTGKPLRN